MCILVLPIYGKEAKMLFPALERTASGNRYGYINEKGRWVLKPYYGYTYPFTEGLGIIEKDNLYGVVDAKGNKVVKPIYESITPFKEERATFVTSKGMGVMNQKGKIITQSMYNYIGGYQEGLAIVEKVSESGNPLYGYLNKEGKESIIPTYQQATDFQNGKALVQQQEGMYAIINTQGQILATIQVPIAYGYNEEKFIYSEKLGGLVGYRDVTGQVIIPPTYQSAEPFREGVAIVSTSDRYKGEQGLINEKGAFIYPNSYNEILYLGEGRVALGKAIQPTEPSAGSIYAIADIKGNILTDFIFYGVSPYEAGLSSVYDETMTYFVNLEGEKVSDLPQVRGAGRLKKQGEVISVEIDYQTSYLTTAGELIYEPNTTIPLGKGYEVKVDKYKPNFNTLIYTPQINGIKDPDIQQQVNAQLKAISDGGEGIEKGEYTYYAQFQSQFYNKDLWIPNLINSTYYFGAAHPLPARATPAIDLVTGTFYELKDLFKAEIPWQEGLNMILQKQAKEKLEQNELFSDAEVKIREQQPFYVDEEALYIYYTPYEIGPYSSGFITFKIPYTEINDLIDKNGDFWMAYH